MAIALSDLEQEEKHEAVLTTKQLGEVIYTAVSEVTRYRLLYCNYNTDFSSGGGGALCSSRLKKAHHHNIDFTCLNRLVHSPAYKEGSQKRKRNKQKIFMSTIQVQELRLCARAHQNVLACKTRSSSCLPILNSYGGSKPLSSLMSGSHVNTRVPFIKTTHR